MAIDPSRIRVDVTFPLSGPPVPRDHSYALFAALSLAIGDLHRAEWLAIHPLRGLFNPDGLLTLTPRSMLRLRLLPAALPRVLHLAGSELTLLGRPIRLGQPQIHTLKPVPALDSRLVVLTGLTEPEPFTAAIRERLRSLGGKGHLTLGRRQVVRIGDRRIVGFGVELRDLDEETSLMLLYEGLGGRQRLGCGVFIPALRRIVCQSVAP